MIQAIPRWMMVRYARIWTLKRDKPFTFDWYIKNIKDDEKIALVFLSRLRIKGWLKVSNDPNQRRKIYTLTKPEEVFENLGVETIVQNEN